MKALLYYVHQALQHYCNITTPYLHSKQTDFYCSSKEIVNSFQSEQQVLVFAFGQFVFGAIKLTFEI